MKPLAQAPVPDFDVYVARPDTVWCEREAGDALTVLYGEGYLPYSGTGKLQNIFYRGSSARIVLQDFELTSENRRIARKFDGRFSKERVGNFIADEDFYSFCVSYFAQKHGPAAMPRERLETILDSGLITNVMIYHSESKPAAYVLEVEDGTMGHFWFSFYDPAYARQSLGLWLMLDALRDAKARGLAHYYLGSVYGQKALYKTNFSPLQWQSGESWSYDVRRLKETAQRD